MNRRRIGDRGEQLACSYLENRGYEIIERNYTIRGGEIDIIALKDDLVHFIEVKYRTSDTYGGVEETMSDSKIATLERTIHHYCAAHVIDEEEVMRWFLGIQEKRDRSTFTFFHF